MLTFLNRPVAGENAFFHLFLFSTLPGSVKSDTTFLFLNPLFSGGSNKMSIDLPFWYNVNDQEDTPERSQCS